ncbi:TonB-dependent receptor [soil metagenome]
MGPGGILMVHVHGGSGARWIWSMLLVLAGCGAITTPGFAQESARYSIGGAVIDAQTAAPLSGAVVVLEPAAMGVLPSHRSTGPVFLQAGRSVLTDRRGGYRFKELPQGEYRLRVQRLGYRPATVLVELRTASDTRLSVGLDVEPISLQPVTVASAAPPEPFGRAFATTPGVVEQSRVAARRNLEGRFLETDARELTHADVIESVTLAEPDIFRALQRLPGVSARDDYNTQLWVRGASWSQTRVTFDGLPLFNPLHGAGTFSSVNTDAVGAAFLHPGVRAASSGEGAAAAIDIRTRSGLGQEKLRGFADLSLVSARLAMDREELGGRAAWMIAARRTYLDQLVRAVGTIVDDEDVSFPYAFSDVAGRFDVRLDERRTLEVSALHERDRVSGSVPDVLHGNRAAWGNLAARATLATPLFGYASRHTVGMTRYGARVRQTDHTPGPFDAPTEPDADSRVRYFLLAGEISPGHTTAQPSWSMGYEAVSQSVDYHGPPGRPYPAPVSFDTLAIAEHAAHLALWGERRWRPGERLTVRTGLRAEAGEAVRNLDRVRIAPRLSARYQASPDLAVSAGWGRTFQYLQDLAPTGPGISAGFDSGQLHLLASREVPAIRSDIATVGAEHWLGKGWLAAANAFVRRAEGLVVPDPNPGTVADRPLFVEAGNAARGAELSARRLAGRWTASAAYAYTISEIEAEGIRFPAAQERRHVLDLTAVRRIGERNRLGGAFSAASGAPFTRFYPGAPVSANGAFAAWSPPPRVEAPNAVRTAPYSSLDLFFDTSRPTRLGELGAYLQARNTLDRRNAVTYQGTPPEGGADSFQAGLPRLWVAGVRLAF